MGRPKQQLTAKIELFIRMSARGESRADIMQEVFGLDLQTASQRDIHNADCSMSRWRKLPEFAQIWREEVDRILLKHTGKAVKTIAGLMESDQPWLQLQAANSLLNYSKSRVYGDEQNQVTVKVEGMPDLGSPDQADDDV